MGKRYIIMVLSAIFALVSMSMAAAQTGGGIAVSDVKMMRTGDSVALEMTVKISVDAVPELQGMEVVPTLSDGAGNIAHFPAVVVNGRNRSRIYERQVNLGYGKRTDSPPFRVVNPGRDGSDMTIDYAVRLACEEWMDGAYLNLVYVLVSPAGERNSYSLPVSGTEVAE